MNLTRFLVGTKVWLKCVYKIIKGKVETTSIDLLSLICQRKQRIASGIREEAKWSIGFCFFFLLCVFLFVCFWCFCLIFILRLLKIYNN